MTSSLETSSQNIDDVELAHFSKMATHWWDPQGECKPLHLMNPVRLDYILARAEGLFGKNVLDVGCGGGILSESMAREGAKVTGLDMSSAPLQVARQHAEQSKLSINYVQETVETHAQHFSNHYDVITCMEMLEHVPNPESVLYACADLVKTGGDIFFSTLNRNIKSWLLAIVGAEYVLRLLPRGTHDVKKFIRPAELLRWMDKTSLKEQHITGIHYHPFNQHFYLNSDVSVNYILHVKRRVLC